MLAVNECSHSLLLRTKRAIALTLPCQVVEIVMFEKASALNIRRGDQPIGIATVLLAQLPPEPTVLWYDLMPARPGDPRPPPLPY